MKILIVGFPRSGTTLTHRIFNGHPDVKEMRFEKWTLKQAKNKEELIKKFPLFSFTSGEKVIWEKRIIGKKGKTTDTIADYCKKWNDWFQDEARIVQIIRHPFDSLNSLVISKKRFPRGPAFSSIYPQYLECAEKFIREINEFPNTMTIKYETLVTEPEKTIKQLYKHCNINSKHAHPERMKKARIFNYKNKNFLFKYNKKLENIIDSFNKIEGVQYNGLLDNR